VAWVVVRTYVDSPVGGQLRGIDQDFGSGSVCLFCQAVDGVQNARDVRRTTDGDQLDPAGMQVQQPVKVVLVHRTVVVHSHVEEACLLAPRQVVGVVFH
jgi:hypothetical protein